MHQNTIPTINEMRAFVAGSNSLVLSFDDKSQAYAWLQELLKSSRYNQLGKADKGFVRAYAMAFTGYQSAQLTRLIRQHTSTCKIKRKTSSRHVFAAKYSREDILALAEIDNAHDRLSGPAALRLCVRAYVTFGDGRYGRLAGISVSHIYNLRSRPTYRLRAVTFTRTQATVTAIGERRKPRPEGRPGFIRVDTVHQGDLDKVKGVYHINLVDEATQWEAVVAVESITEKHMVPALEAALGSFPFLLTNFHADNGSEYINRRVAELLERLLMKLTKSRAYHSGDNGLVETKNGSIIRKALGYGHIPRIYAPIMNDWYRQWFVPYLNFHRPCGYRTTTVDPKTGKRTHTYPAKNYKTPYEFLRSLPDSKVALRTGITFAKLDGLAYAMSDTDWAKATAAAKGRMLQTIQLKEKELATGLI